VITGSGVLTQTVFLTDSQLGAVTDLVWGKLDGASSPKLCVSGTGAAVFTDRQGKSLASVTFPGTNQALSVVDVEGDGVCEFINRGSWGMQAALYDHRGKQLWTYGGSSGVDDMAAGDVDGDGREEFVVGFNGGGGVHLLDSQGKLRWKKNDGNVWHVEITDTNGDGRPEILHSCAAGEMVIRDASGAELLRQRPPTGYFSHFSLSAWPDRGATPLRVISGSAGSVQVLDFQAKVLANLTAPDAPQLGAARATPVKLHAGQPAFFAVLVDVQTWNRALLYLYDAQGQLVYEESLPERAQALAALPESNGAESLLVGGEGRVWKYQAGAKPAGGQ